ncbi:hypothetical protein A1O1_05443 [Capronia coronata CBS 617.96]|uniref:Uncharacterized protein n=1 Tax=Capronia coronata CBS 617.96 TaxID=1182541 RepID=W9Y7L4_9EURO|nr:uncharacterized protein A1O1_05443 [Capronia coronata CBS 617.96]EXJ88513.1 hypothetical protein A1O1_05443 [Capronia coronata CBS 617.96]
MQQTPSPAFIPLPPSVPPATRTGEASYYDQHGWSPFDEYEFTFAALAFIESSENEFRELIRQPGGFWQFWYWCDLPQETSPFKDTRALALWEVDGLLNTILQRNHVPRSVLRRMIDEFKSRIRLAFVRKHKPLGESTSLFAPISPHRPSEKEETGDDSLSVEGPSMVDDDDRLFCISTDDVSEPAHDEDSMSAGEYIAGLARPSPSINVLLEEERIAKACKVPENFKRRGKAGLNKETIDEQLNRATAEGETATFGFTHATRFTSYQAESGVMIYSPIWSADFEAVDDRNARTSTTTTGSKWSSTSPPATGDGSEETVPTSCSTISTEATDEDEMQCHGIV